MIIGYYIEYVKCFVKEYFMDKNMHNNNDDYQRLQNKLLKKEKNKIKQKEYREMMKYIGYKQAHLWTIPCSAKVRKLMKKAGFQRAVAWEKPDDVPPKMKFGNLVKVITEIHTESFHAGNNIPEVKSAVYSAISAFYNGIESSSLNEDMKLKYVLDFRRLLNAMYDSDLKII